MKKILDNINTEEYFEWYSSWIDWKNVTADQIKNGSAGVNPYGMFSEWLDTKAVKMNDILGKEIYYPLNAEREDAITTDTYFEGVSIHYGRVDNITQNENGYVISINGREYFVSKYEADLLFYENKDMLIARLHYDGTELYEGITLINGYEDNLYIDKTQQ